MEIEIFEAEGFGVSTGTDVMLIDLFKRYEGVEINKINVVDKDQMNSHKDVVKALQKDGLDVLPLIKVNGKLMDEDTFAGELRSQI